MAKKNSLEAAPIFSGRQMQKIVFETIKIGIIKSNLIAMFAGLSMALLINNIPMLDKIGEITLAIIGSAFVIGAAGTFNNLYDRDIDFIMERTKNRPTVTGQMSSRLALSLGSGMSLLGVVLLYMASPLSALFGFLGLFLYVVPYTIWTKRRTIYNTEVGSFSGAVPPLIGWSAVSSDLLEPGAIALFVVMLLWQMPHFYAIAIRRHDEYKAANVPMLPVVKGFQRTYIQTNVYLAALVLASFLFWSLSPIIVAVAFILSAGWLIMSIMGYKKMTSEKWAKMMFIYSLNHLTLLLAVVIGYSLIRPLF
ncbi:heme o synthase [Paenibacillus sp. y28]|uniref:heme o synthase n=1 Tax=Paenibacillus sp. y28 TaxID=3129110 RepID=UPI00301AB166